MSDCVFCKILAGELPSKKFYEDERMIVIADIEPRARLHYLVVPKRHYKFVSEMTDTDAENFAAIMRKIGEIAPGLGLENGYRIIINQGDDALQSVPHLHIHLLGGEKLNIENAKSGQ